MKARQDGALSDALGRLRPLRADNALWRRCVAVFAMQVIVLQPLVTYHPAAAAQDSGDGGEGAGSCSVSTSNGPAPDPDPDPDDNLDPDEGLGGDSGADTQSDAPHDDTEATPDTGSGVDGAADAGTDGGDFGDGGGASGDPGGGDGDGWDGSTDGAPGGDFTPSEGALSGSVGAGCSREFCSVADPIDVRLADKIHTQVDYLSRGAAPVRLARVYHSNAAVYSARTTILIGAGWRSFYDRSLQVVSGTSVRLHRANGRVMQMTWNGSAWTSTLPAGYLTQISGGWQYVNHRNTIESYDASGRLAATSRGGLVTNFQYDAASRLVRVANPFGRALAFAYDGAGRVASVALPDGSTIGYGYDTRGNLVSTRFADNSIRQYAYENTSFPNALTGVVDEAGRRRLTWGYDSAGRPNYSHYGSGSDAVSIVYSGNQVSTTDARGTQRTRTFATIGSRAVLTGLQTAATADSAATAWSFSYDGNGNSTGLISRSGETRQFVVDGRGRILNVTRAAGTAQAVSSQLTWHWAFRKPVQVVHKGITRSYSIDNSGRVSQVSEVAGGSSRVVLTKVYNAQSLLQSATDARGAGTSYTYDASGNRITRTNVLGQVTRYLGFNAHGQAGRIERPDGSVVARAFDIRGRVASRTLAGRTTQYAYDASGRVTRITAPDGGWRGFSYNSAGWLNGKTNHRGESTAFVRDATGKVVGKSVYSAAGGLVQTNAAQYNAVGRLASVIDSRNYRTRFLYASDGRPSGVTDPLGLTRTLQLDALSRKTAVTQPNTSAMRQSGGPATTTVAHAYDGAGNHRLTTDTNAVATTYSHDGFNRRVAEANVDGGNLNVTRNAAGDVVSFTSARGITYTLTRDSVGRLTAIAPSGGVAMNYSYVAGRSDGLLAQMTDPSGSSAWTYDSAGRMLTKQQTIGGVTRSLSVTRDTLGRSIVVVYPSGLRLNITYSADVVSNLSLNGVPLLDNVTYRAFSKLASGWRWGNGSSYSRSFDTDGRVTGVTLGSTQRSLAYDAAGRVSSFADVGPGGTRTSSLSYDEAGQLISFAGPQGSASYAWDTNGNRRSQTLFGATSSYTYAPGTNRLLTLTGMRNFQYNANGSASTDGAFQFTYDGFDRLGTVSVPSQSNLISTYNGLGLRVKKLATEYRSGGALQAGPGNPAATATTQAATAATGTWVTTSNRQFFHDDDGHLLGEYDSADGYSQETVWFNGMPVATVQGGSTYYIHPDHLGTPRAIRRASDNLEVWRWDSDPFGSTPESYPAGGVYIKYNLRFPGQYLDVETGYHYNGLRDYDPWTGRYLQADPLGLGGGLARYSYVGGNPVSRTDPRGLYWFQQGWQAHDPIVGRQNTFVAPGGPISSFVERYVPAGRTLAEIHDPMVDTFTGLGVPGWLANIPTMPSAYASAIGLEILRSLGIAKQPSPPNLCPR